ncbi:MAG: winged helix DNA-binding protein [Microthrixaceae bacterium]
MPSTVMVFVPLQPKLELARRAVLLARRMGVGMTVAIVDAGLGELSSNAALVVVTQLVDGGSARPRDLIGPTRLTRGGLSNLFDRLESAGFITREYGAVDSDRRGAMVSITAAGGDAVARIGEVVDASFESLRPEMVDLADAVASIGSAGERDAPGSLAPGSVGQLMSLGLAGAAMAEAVVADRADEAAAINDIVVLCCVAQSGRTQPKEIIEQAILSSGGVSQLLGRLEDAELITKRTGCTPDRRATMVELTTKGRQLLEDRLAKVSDHLMTLRPGLYQPPD